MEIGQREWKGAMIRVDSLAMISRVRAKAEREWSARWKDGMR